MSLAGTVAALQDAAGYLAAVHQDAILQAFGSHFCALAARELAETFRALRPASAGNCLPDSIPPQMGRPCFLMSPDEEVEHWVSQLLPLPEDAALNLLRQMPVYSEYIRQHSIEEVAQHMADGVKSMIGATLCADEALEVGPRLGAVMPLPLAVCLLYCSRTTAKPHYFLSDLCFSFLANLAHTGQRVQLYQSDPSMKVAVKYWAIPTGDTTAGKSPSFNLVSDMCVRFLQGQGDLWPWADQEDQNLHSDGTHGLFNEQTRDHSGHVCFVGPEAVNYLSPLYAEKGVCDTSAYVNLPKLLECATVASTSGGQPGKFSNSGQQPRQLQRQQLTRPQHVSGHVPGVMQTVAQATPPRLQKRRPYGPFSSTRQMSMYAGFSRSTS